MFCKSASGVLAILLATSCMHNVPQDQATGEDGKSKGAKEITLENGEGHVTDIVTYPGGDRVDWKFVQLPDKKVGDLDIKLTWTPPRPGLQLAFDVYDEWFWPIGENKKFGKKRHGRTRSASIQNAKGKYYIRVYALGRGDAGKYKLNVEFKEVNGPIGVDLTKIDIAEPPKLAALPDPEKTCDEFHFDINNPACGSVCAPTAPANWPGCAGKCITPDVNNQACWKSMACPKPPNRNVVACKPRDFPKCPDINNPDPENPNCDHATLPPVMSSVIKSDVQGSDVIITIAAGSDAHIEKSWSGQVLRGDSQNPLDGGEITIVRVTKRETVGKVHLTPDQVSANPRVKLSPPPK